MPSDAVGAVLAVATGGISIESARGVSCRCELPLESVTCQALGRAVKRAKNTDIAATATPSTEA
jgi:hypothetical protein